MRGTPIVGASKYQNPTFYESIDIPLGKQNDSNPK